MEKILEMSEIYQSGNVLIQTQPNSDSFSGYTPFTPDVKMHS